ncbi:hypothetical protein BsWGS_16514 [Bradybaena similaris]
MRGLVRSLAAVMLLLVQSRSIETGIDKGTVECSREKGNDILYAEKGDYGYIVSGGYPGNYSTAGKSGVWCQVHVQVCRTCRLRLQFEELSFELCLPSGQGSQGELGSDWCHKGCDHLHVHEVDPPYNRVTHRNYFSYSEGESYTSISGNVKVRHCTGSTSLEDGKRFRIAYTVIDKTELYKGVVSEYGDSTGYITSPNFPGGYALNGETFTYMIQNLDPYGHVRLIFDDWDLAPESKVKVYDGFSETSPHTTLERYTRPVIVSRSNTLVLVLSTGTRLSDCCHHSGFKGQYQYVSEQDWKERPDSTCSEAHPMQGGGIISFTGGTSSGPRFYDCLWVIKRYSSHYTADAVILRLREVLLGDGWLQYGRKNTLEIRSGGSSESPLVARFTARNLTDIQMSYTSHQGLYVRLRGGFYSTDKLSFIYTAVKNVTEGGDECPGYFDFLCRNLLCIDQELMCDGVDHCGDASDESPSVDCSVSGLWKHSFKWSMPYLVETTVPNKPACNGIVCGRVCLSLDQICDGVADCAGREDEDNCAKTSRQNNGGTTEIYQCPAWLPLFVMYLFTVYTTRTMR